MKDTRICDNCGAEHPISKMFEVEGDWLCEDCVDRLTVTCDRCGDRIYQESAIEDDHHTSARAVLTSIMSAATTVAASCAAMMPTSMTTIIPIARIAGTSIRARFTTTTIRPTLCSTARACGILA